MADLAEPRCVGFSPFLPTGGNLNTHIRAPTLSHFGLRQPRPQRSRPRLSALLDRPLERVLGLGELQRIYGGLPAHSSALDFTRSALAALRVETRVPPAELAELPARGGLLVVANHPFGAVEGLVLGELLSRVRPDVKILANHLLGRVQELREWLILVDPFGGPEAQAKNRAPLRAALDWLRQGHVLVVFPAGEVSCVDLKRRRVQDRAWSPAVVSLARLAHVDVQPVFFSGRNGALFQLAGLLHPRLRTALLAKQLIRQRGRVVDVRIGARIPQAKLQLVGDEGAQLEYLRMRTYALQRERRLRQSSGWRERLRPGSRKTQPEALVPPVSKLDMQREIESLRRGSLLVESGELEVLHMRAGAAPALLREIGRLRELTFRANQEGTGRELDLDQFDLYYDQVLLWNRVRHEVVGAYRIARMREVLAAYGPRGLYTNTLFEHGPRFVERLEGALELGRSFVRPECQRSFAPLLLLWRGICTYIARQGDLHTLFGAVSIKSGYQQRSRELIVHHLLDQHGQQDLLDATRPRQPLRPAPRPAQDLRRAAQLLPDLEELSSLIADIEPDRKGIPVLLREYLRLGGRVLCFNVDPQFSSVLDALVLVDLRQTSQHLLERYMGNSASADFLRRHGLPVDERPRRERRRAARELPIPA